MHVLEFDHDVDEGLRSDLAVIRASRGSAYAAISVVLCSILFLLLWLGAS